MYNNSSRSGLPAPYYIPPPFLSSSSAGTSCSDDHDDITSPPTAPDDTNFVAAIAALPPSTTPLAPRRGRRQRRPEHELAHFRRTVCRGPKYTIKCRLGKHPCNFILRAEDPERSRAHVRWHWAHQLVGPYYCQGRTAKDGKPCQRGFDTLDELVKHFETHLYWRYMCYICNSDFSRLDALQRHEKTKEHRRALARRR